LNVLKSRKFAAVVLVACIIAAIFMGQARKPGDYVDDGARALSTSQISALRDYNARWDKEYGRVVAFVSVNDVSGNWDDYAFRRGNDMGLGEGDALILYVKGEDDYTVALGDDMARWIDSRTEAVLNDPLLSSRDFTDGVMEFYGLMDTFLKQNFSEQTAPARGGSLVGTIVLLVIIAVVVLIIFSAIESARFNAYRTRYYGMMTPPVIYRPIFPWHRPGSSWYSRHWRPAPPPPPRRPPNPPRSGGGGPKSPPPRSGGFGRSGSSFGGGRSSFGGGRSSSGGGRSFSGGRSSSGGGRSFGGGRSGGGGRSFGGGRGGRH